MDRYDLVICYWDGHKWARLDNIKVDFAAGTVSGEVTHFTKFAVLLVPKKQDESNLAPPSRLYKIPGDIRGHWGERLIMDMIQKGLVSGYPDGNFRPDREVTRAEFAAMLGRFLGAEGDDEKVLMTYKDAEEIAPWSRQVLSKLVDQDSSAVIRMGPFAPTAKFQGRKWH